MASVLANPSAAENVLKMLLEQWPDSEATPRATEEAEKTVAAIVAAACKPALNANSLADAIDSAKAWLSTLANKAVSSTCWTAQGRDTLAKLEDKISDRADKDALAASLFWDGVRPMLYQIGWAALDWAALWLAFIFVFPWSPLVQAAFFYNPKARAFFSLGFVPLLLFLLPPLRTLLLWPFRDDLIAAARPKHFGELGFFGATRASLDGEAENELAELLPRLRGVVVFRGEAGYGKTSALRYIAIKSRRAVAFLHASACVDGVDAAIARILHDVQEKSFVKGLVYSGVMRVVIDGLNEVNAETRVKIADFAQEMSKSDIFIATQPINWSLNSAKILTLRPLDRPTAENFLLTRPIARDLRQPRHDETFKEAAQEFLRHALDEPRSEEERRWANQMLSNPFDLAFAADLLSRGEMPSAVRLIDEAFRLADQKYQEELGRHFPLAAFGQLAVMMRLEEPEPRNWVKPDEFPSETKYLLDAKLLVPRSAIESKEGKSVEVFRNVFRHDRVWDFFLSAAFEHDRTLWERYGSDPRFRGAVLRIAERWDPEKARELQDSLAEFGADTGDHTTGDDVLRVLRARKAARQADAATGTVARTVEHYS
jgi:hypothetical protein